MQPIVRPRRVPGRSIFLLVLAALLFDPNNSANAAKAENPAPTEDRGAPAFSRRDLNHQPVRLTAERGKVVLLNFWATWCAPCLGEIPRFAEWQQKYRGQGLRVIGISMDDAEQPVRALYQKYHVNYPVVMGDEQLGEMYGGILGLPVTFLIDRNGKIRFKHQGSADLDIIEREIHGLLNPAVPGAAAKP